MPWDSRWWESASDRRPWGSSSRDTAESTSSEVRRGRPDPAAPGDAIEAPGGKNLRSRNETPTSTSTSTRGPTAAAKASESQEAIEGRKPPDARRLGTIEGGDPAC